MTKRVMSCGAWVVGVVVLVSAATLPGEAVAQQKLALKRGFDTEGPVVRAVFSPVVEQARRGVVVLEHDGDQVALGTVVTAEGLVLTKASELRRDGEWVALLEDGRRLGFVVLAESRPHDVALIQIRGVSGLTALPLARGVEPRLGQWVVVPGQQSSPIAVGVYSALPRRVNGVRLGVGLSSASGVTIVKVSPDMGAAAAGLEVGDVIQTVMGQAVESPVALVEQLREANVGDMIEIVVERDGKPMVFEVELTLPSLDPARSRRDRMDTMGNDVSKRRDGFASVLQHDATIAPAECGGPLLDLDGRFIGLNIARAGRVEAYALPAELVAEVLAELIAEAESADSPE